ncbi:MAG: MiaB/RimO family radical SAM methylthiotransferase [Clostridia bacterium]
MNTIKTASFYSLGCRVNQYEEQSIREMFINLGYQILNFGTKTDVCVINTCAVTAESERKSRNFIARASKVSKKVIVTGCYAELLSKQKKTADGAFYVGGCKQKSLIPLIADDNYDLPYCHTPEYENIQIGTTDSLPDNRCRAYIKIQDGCNGNCSYCLIPYLRGKSVSRSSVDIVREAKRLAMAGVKEVILTGIETSDYDDIPLCELLIKISQTDGIERIRLGSLNINCITDEFIATIKSSKKFCRHLHLSLQSASNRILNLMRRPYSKEKANFIIKKIYSEIPEMLISVDIITSFPSETEAEFLETVEFVKEKTFMHVHAFSYSPRPFTDAALIKSSISLWIKKSVSMYQY